jgi:hypothetical protein
MHPVGADMGNDETKARKDTRTTDTSSPSVAGTGKLPSEARQTPPARAATDAEVADIVRRVKEISSPTVSRQPTWDMALALQADMFKAVKSVGGLDVQLVYFRGVGECRASKWVSEPDALAALMTKVACAGGFTQIGKVLGHARAECDKRRVSALVYVGDCMEEGIDDLCWRAGELALLGVPVFLFQEGEDISAEKAFREIARLTKGAYCRFDAGSAAQLRELLAAVAVYAAGGRKALQALAGHGARRLLRQLE